MALFENLSTQAYRTFRRPAHAPPVALHDFSTVGSHSWTEIGGDPALAVPGRPSKWIKPRIPLRVPPDEGLRFIDHSGAQCQRLGVSRLMPIIQGVELCTPDFRFQDMNIVCNRNNMRNLLAWIEGSDVKDFRIDVCLANEGKTLLLQEHEVEATEYIDAGTFRGFGDNFRKHCVQEVPGQTRHNRIITFKFGEFRVLMGHKVEAYHDERATTTHHNPGLPGSSSRAVRGGQKGMGSALPQPTEDDLEYPDEGVPIYRTKDLFREYPFVEIKTMAQRKEINWRTFHPQLYLSQTDLLIVARYSRGQFVSIEKYRLQDPLLAQESQHTERALGRLLELFRSLLGTLKEAHGNWALVCISGTLYLYQSEEGGPQDVLSYFE